MKSIWKFPISFNSKSVSVPKGTKFLSVQVQTGQPVIWGLIDVESSYHVNADVLILGTGWGVEEDYLKGLSFLGTIQLHNGLVFHFFVPEEMK